MQKTELDCPIISIEAESWLDLEPTMAMIRALDYADRGSPEIRDVQNDKRRWSELFADGCAWMIADEIRKYLLAVGLLVLPEKYGQKSEPVILLGDTKKSVDVAVVAKHLMGLQVGFSLKGFNTMDCRTKAYDKNLRARVSEVATEMLFIHSHLPRAKMIAIYFMPIEAGFDKSSPSSSSFARAVDIIGRQTGRAHPFLNPENSDKSFIALYSKDFSLGVQRGVLRLFDVNFEPNGSGLPVVPRTYSLDEVLRDHCYLDPTKNSKPLVLTEQLKPILQPG